MYFIYYIVLPLLVAWQKRSANLAEQVFALYTTMLSAFLAIWGVEFVQKCILTLIPDNKSILPWLPSAVILVNWVIVGMLIFKCMEIVLPQGLTSFQFPEKVSKFLTPLVAFLHTGLVCALLFTIVAVSPVSQYADFIFKNDSLCSATRYRMLWNSFLVDRFSFQTATVNQRRRAFDRFVPEFPNKKSTAETNSSIPRKDK